jgi:hypothetical protein
MIVVVVPGAKEEGEAVTEGVAVIPAGVVVESLPVGLEPPVVLSPVGLEPPVVLSPVGLEPPVELSPVGLEPPVELSPVGLEPPVLSSLVDGTPVGMTPSLVEEEPDSVAEETGAVLEWWLVTKGVELGTVWVWVWVCVWEPCPWPWPGCECELWVGFPVAEG